MELDLFKTTLVASNVWIGFAKDPNLDDIEDARRLLNQLCDELIKEKINE
jgi:hypothetical protein